VTEFRGIFEVCFQLLSGNQPGELTHASVQVIAMGNILNDLWDELILMEEDPHGEYRQLPSWVAHECDPGRRTGILSALRRFGYEDSLSSVDEETEQATGPFPDAA
jgi:hypothetical protein